MLIILAGAWPMLLWFTLLSPNGWLRHILPSVLMIMLVWVSFAVYYIRRTRVVWMAILCISLFLSVFASVTSTSSRMTFALSKGDHNAQWKKWASGNAMVIQLFYSHPVFSWSDQTQVVDYIRHLPPSKNVFYIGSFYMAEIAALSDRVIGPITRYSVHDGADPIIIFGPYQRGALTRLDPQYHADMQKQLCRKTVLENASYLLCVMKPEYYSSFMK